MIKKKDIKFSLACGFMVVGLGVYVYLNYYRLPYFDSWEFVAILEQYHEGTLTWADLIARHVTHWHTAGYLAMLAGAQLTDYSHLTEAFISVLIACASFVIATYISTESFRRTDIPMSAWPVAALVAFFVLSFDQYVNWLWGWQISVHLNILGMLLCVLALTRSSLTVAWLFVGVLGAVLAIYSFATGLVLIPIGFALLGARQACNKKPIWLAVWAVFTVAVVGHVYAEFVAGGGHQYLNQVDLFAQANFRAMFNLLTYAVNFLAGAIVRFDKDLAVVMTSFGFVLLGLLLLQINQRKLSLSGLLPVLAIIAYGAGAALLTAIGRAHLGTDHGFATRYVSFSNFYWLGTLLLLIGLLGLPNQSLTTRRLMMATLVLLLLVKAVNQFDLAKRGVRESNKIETTAIKLCRSAASTVDLSAIANQFQDVHPSIQFLRTNGLGYFKTCALTQTGSLR